MKPLTNANCIGMRLFAFGTVFSVFYFYFSIPTIMASSIYHLFILTCLSLSWWNCSGSECWEDRLSDKAKIGSIERGKVLLVAAHQDDEVFILSRLRAHQLLGDSIFVIWTAMSVQVDEEYAQRRVKESLRVMDLLGIDKSRCISLRFVDGETYKNLHAIVDTLTVLMTRISPRTIYVPAFEGGHIDHDIANYAVAKIASEHNLNAMIYEYPIYSAYATFCLLPFTMRQFSPKYPAECRRLSSKEYEFVMDCWDRFESQKFPLGWYLSVMPGEIATFGIEYIRRLPHYDYLQRPSDGNIAYERFLDCSFHDFKQAILHLSN